MVSAIAFALFAVFSRHTLYLQVRLPPVRADATAATRYTCHSPSRARRCHTATTLFIGPPEFTFRHLPAASVAVGRRGHAALRRRGMILVGSCGSHRAGQQQSHGSSCFASGRAPGLHFGTPPDLYFYISKCSALYFYISLYFNSYFKHTGNTYNLRFCLLNQRRFRQHSLRYAENHTRTNGATR